MNWNILNQPLGSGISNGYMPRRKMAIPLAIPLVMAAASVASSAFGAAKSSSANRDAQARLAAEKAATEAERRRAKYQTWASTASGQNTIRMLNDQSRRAYQQMRGAAAVGGATEASVAAEKELQNLKQAEVIAQANANFEDKKDNIDASYRQQLSGLNQQLIGLDQQKGQAIAQAASGVSSALAQGAMATFGGTKLGQSWMNGGSPAAGGVESTSVEASPSQSVPTNVEIPVIGNDMFKHAFGKIPSYNDPDWWKRVLRHADFSKYNS